MENHLHEPLRTTPKPDLTKEEKQVEEDMASLRAEGIVHSLAFPMVLKAVLELGVIDTIAGAGDGEWLSPSEITVRLPTKPVNPEAAVIIDRMLQLLVTHSFLKCHVIERENGPERVYAAETICNLFLKDGHGSDSFLSGFMLLYSHVYFKTWTNLKDVVLEGKDAFNSAHGMGLFEYMGSDKQLAELFNRTLSEASSMTMRKVLEVYRGFEDVNTLVDVGGGNGTILGLVTSKYPHIKGVNFDLPQVISHAPKYQGVEHVPGDMLIEVPKGDAIFLKSVLHDWTDENCIKILKNCWKSLPEKGKVIVVEMITPTKPKPGDVPSSIVYSMDLLMLTQCSGGKERSLSEFENIAFSSGFHRCEIVCTAVSYSVIEFHKCN